MDRDCPRCAKAMWAALAASYSPPAPRKMVGPGDVPRRSELNNLDCQTAPSAITRLAGSKELEVLRPLARPSAKIVYFRSADSKSHVQHIARCSVPAMNDATQLLYRFAFLKQIFTPRGQPHIDRPRIVSSFLLKSLLCFPVLRRGPSNVYHNMFVYFFRSVLIAKK